MFLFGPMRKWMLVALLASFWSLAAWAQTTDKPAEDPQRREAFALYEAGKLLDAMPLLEKLAADYPSDVLVRERWAFSVMAYSHTITDPEERKKTRIRARNIALAAKALGGNSNLLQVVLDLPADGSIPPFSSRKEVDDAMKAAEADFVRGNWDAARAGYLRTLEFDPTNYEAALFMGDAYFKQHMYDSAGEWFARAIKIDPNRETAYRYWGDALVAALRDDDARGKFLDAVIAEPYNKRAWVGVQQWADRNKLKLNVLALQEKSSLKIEGDQSTITLDEKDLKSDQTGAAWLAYSGTRLLWQRERFKKAFPNETAYRRSLQEETEALHTVVEVIADDVKTKKTAKGLDPSLLALIQLDQQGLLEPFVLFNRADNGIVQDYAAYRAAHRDVLRRYLDEFVVPRSREKPAQ